MNDKPIELSVIVSSYNEEKTIIKVLNRLSEIKKQDFVYEVIVINDGSTDNSFSLLEQNKDLYDQLITYEKNNGKGHAVLKGLEAAKGKYIIFQDADLEYDPKDYDKILSPLINGKADVVYGSRFSGSEERKIHFFWHTLANRLLTFFCNLKTNLNLSDMECGFKAFKSEAIKQINLKENRFGFEPEVTIKLARKKVSFYEVGINYYGRSYQEGKKIGIKDAVRALYVILVR